MTSRILRPLLCLLFLSGAGLLHAQSTGEPPDVEIPDLPGELPPGDPPALPPLPLPLLAPSQDGGGPATVSIFQAVEAGANGVWEQSIDLENWSELSPPATETDALALVQVNVVAGTTVFVRWRELP